MRTLGLALSLLIAATPALAADIRFEVGKSGFALAPASLTCVRWTHNDARQVVVQIGLDKAAAARLAALTGGNVGKQMVLVAGGKPVFTARIVERIADGRIQIAGSLTISDAETLVRNLGGKRGDCAAFPAPRADPEKKSE